MIIAIIKQALQSLTANPGRSILTMLGVIIGISSVVLFIALGEGLRRDIKQEITSLGSNLLFVLPGDFKPGQSQFSTNIISGDILKLEDVTDLKLLPAVETASPMMLVGGIIRRETKPAAGSILLGTESTLPEILTTLKLKTGRFFNDQENLNQQQVIVLGEAIANQLFDEGEDPLGKTIAIGKANFTILGTIASQQTASALGGTDYGAISFLPLKTAGALTDGVKIHRILLKLNPETDVKGAIPSVEAVLLARHAKGDFTVLTQEDILGFLDTILKLLTAAIIAIAAISLVVAGVGIMNIMLVAVTERTREIGLRKAIGASNGLILAQFLIEAILLTVVGALLALALSFGAAGLISRVAPLNPVITPAAIALAVGVAVAVGIVFGLAPAIRAARLDPIQALRYE